MSLNGELYESFEYEEQKNSDGTHKDAATVINAKGEKFKVVAEKNGRFEAVYYYNSLILKKEYDKHGQLCKISDSLADETTQYYYDSCGNVLNYEKKRGNLSYSEKYIYNNKGSVTKVVYSGAVSRTDKFTFSGKAADSIIKVNTGDFTVFPKQDINERYIGKTVNVRNIEIDSESVIYLKEGDHATHLPKQISYKPNSSENSIIDYTYDANGNIIKIMQGGEIKSRYEYDSLNRLIREDNRAKNESYFYKYDNNGNILSKETCEFTVGEHELGTGSVVTYIYDKDKLIKVGSENSTFDAVGNPTLYRGKSAVWTRGRKLVKLSNNLFEYDSQGKRIKKNAITYIYDSQNRLIKQSNGLEFFYDIIGLLGFSYNGNYYYYRKDVQGNVIAILDSNGNVVVQYEYDAWGNHTVSGSNTVLGNLNPFRYRSYYFDTETKLYFLQTRYYDPEIGRFINIDSIEYADPETINGLNLYAYCDNNPVMGYDPEGTANWGVFAQLVVSLWSYVGYAIASIFDSGVREDMNRIHWNPFNNNEQLVFDSKHVSFFRGVPVIKTSDSFSGTFTFLWIFYQNSDTDTNGVKHEWGHVGQLMLLDPLEYLLYVGIPSALKWGRWDKEDNYYGAPWETMADMFGGVDGWKGKKHTSTEKALAVSHLIVAKLFKYFSFFFVFC